MIHLGRVSIFGTGIVFGGVTLGAALASFANPLPRPAEPPPWHNTLNPQIAVGDLQPYPYSMPEDLTPASVPDGYTPPAAFTEMRWPVEQPAQYRAEPAPAVTADTAYRTAAASDNAPFADRPVSVPHYAAIEQAAREGAAAPGDNSANDEPSAARAVNIDSSSPPPQPTGGVHIIHVAGAG